MFVIRSARPDDSPTLLKLAKMVQFINLPADLDIINRKVAFSRKSFRGEMKSERDRQFMFVLEETETGNVIGTSGIMSCISWPGRPHTYFQVRKREHYSEDLQTGQVHLTLQLGTDETGPSEIGGLVLSPSYRGHKGKLGALLSLVRFHFIGLHRPWFAERMIAEMMGPLTHDSRNTLWEYLGRRFINLSFVDADRFCQYSKEFITSLLPDSEIYASLLPPEARNLIGKVGPETEPARAMLEQLGFEYKGHVDPFDAGPYLEARVDDITLVRNTNQYTLSDSVEAYDQKGIVSYEAESDIRALRTGLTIRDNTVAIPGESAEAIGAQPGATVGVTPLQSTEKQTETESAPRKQAHGDTTPVTEPTR